MLEMKSASQWRQYLDAGMSQWRASDRDSIDSSEEKKMPIWPQYLQ